MKLTKQRARRRPVALATLMTVAASLGISEIYVLVSLARRLGEGRRES